MAENSDKTWSTGEGNDKPFHYSCLENPINSMKRQKGMTLKISQVSRCPICYWPVVQLLSRFWLCNPKDCSTPGFPVLHYLLELIQTHVHLSVVPSNHVILCHPLLLLPSIFPSIRVFSKELVLHIRWPKYWSLASVLLMNVQDWCPLGLTGLISLQSLECQD